MPYFPPASAGTVTNVSGTAPVAVATGTTTPVVSVPAFVASGGSHAAGLVPDPGASAATTHYLREDATWAVPAAGALTTASATLGADVTMTSANTYYDGPAVSCAAGTWLLTGSIAILNPAVNGVTAKLWDGTTVFAAAENVEDVAGNAMSLAVCAIVSPGTTTTYKISAANTGAGGTIKAAATYNSPGNYLSYLHGVKIA